jgi:simple sugar transport system ATP-binding protein
VSKSAFDSPGITAVVGPDPEGSPISQTDESPAIAAIGITRTFPGVVANDHVDFEVLPGEVHALLGENGSGKTTLCKILTGLYRPDEGQVEVNGRAVRFNSPRDSFEAGVFMVQQHFSLVNQLTVAENVVLGWTRHKRFWFSARRVEEEVAASAEQFHISVDPKAFVWQLSVGERQRVEILKALYRDVRILILDEPTTVLTPQECEELFASLRALAGAGASVVFVTHKLPEVTAVCDRVSILRQGRSVGTFPISEGGTDLRSLARLMVGRDVTSVRRSSRRLPEETPVVLEITGVSVSNQFGRLGVRDVSLQVRRGEIVGIAGVSGNGQRELAEAVTGMQAHALGQVRVADRVLRNESPRSAIDAGMAYVPEDRLGTGLVGTLTVSDNAILKSFRSSRFCFGPLLRGKIVSSYTDELLSRFDVKGTSATLVRQLSGGNAQKVLLAREMSSDPKVLVVASPSRGLDISATENVRKLLIEAADRGVAVLLISEDLGEVLDLSDRVAVMYGGRIVGVVDPHVVDLAQIGLMMAGIEGSA